MLLHVLLFIVLIAQTNVLFAGEPIQTSRMQTILCNYSYHPRAVCKLYSFWLVYASTREQGDVTSELKKMIKAIEDSTTLTQDSIALMRVVLRGQLRPVSSSVSTKRLEDYRRVAIEYYCGSHADTSRIICVVKLTSSKLLLDTYIGRIGRLEYWQAFWLELPQECTSHRACRDQFCCACLFDTVVKLWLVAKLRMLSCLAAL